MLVTQGLCSLYTMLLFGLHVAGNVFFWFCSYLAMRSVPYVQAW